MPFDDNSRQHRHLPSSDRFRLFQRECRLLPCEIVKCHSSVQQGVQQVERRRFRSLVRRPQFPIRFREAAESRPRGQTP